MKVYKVNLEKEYSFLQGGELECILTEYPFDWTNDEEIPDCWKNKANNWHRPALIVLPGGGYAMCSKREAGPIATAFLAKGFHTFILNYLHVGNGVRYPEELLEAATAVDYVRKHAEELHVNPKEVFVVGFSAGGHLAGNLAVEHQNVEKKAGVALDCKPTAVGLGYPVISYKHGHTGSYDNLLPNYSEEEKAEIFKWVNLDEAVSEQTPPAFIWTTAEDTCVPPRNAMYYALALDKQKIPYELHVYPRCNHGLASADAEVNMDHPELARISNWVDDCSAFFHLFTVEKF